MKIRKATIKDVPEMRKIDRFAQILKKCSPIDRLDPKYKLKKGEKSYFEKFVLGKNKWVYIAEENKKIVGFVLFNIEKREPYWNIKKVGYIDLLFVSKTARQKGIANMFLEKAYEIFKTKDLDYVTLDAQTANNLAIKVWKRKGFKHHKLHLFKKI